jgi:hypothetical protein
MNAEPRGIRGGSETACLLVLWVRIPTGAWMSVSCQELCVVRLMSLRRADHSSRGVLQSALCPKSVIMKPRKGSLWPGIGSKLHRKRKK